MDLLWLNVKIFKNKFKLILHSVGSYLKKKNVKWLESWQNHKTFSKESEVRPFDLLKNSETMRLGN